MKGQPIGWEKAFLAVPQKGLMVECKELCEAEIGTTGKAAATQACEGLLLGPEHLRQNWVWWCMPVEAGTRRSLKCAAN